jgi:hypothetical protein
MDTAVRTDRTVWTEAVSGVSWASIMAGAFVAAAVSLALLALGAGLGLDSVSPWSGSAVSGSTFTNISGAYLLMVAIMSSAIGGYLASRLRTRWTDFRANEVFSRQCPRLGSLGCCDGAECELARHRQRSPRRWDGFRGSDRRGRYWRPKRKSEYRIRRQAVPRRHGGAIHSGRCGPDNAGHRRYSDVRHCRVRDLRSFRPTEQQRGQGRGWQVVDLKLHRRERLAAGRSSLRRPSYCAANRHQRCRCAKNVSMTSLMRRRTLLSARGRTP